MKLMRLALKIIIQNDRYLMEVILLSLGPAKHYFTTLLKNTICIFYMFLTVHCHIIVK